MQLSTNLLYQTTGKRITLTFQYLPVVHNSAIFMGFIPYPFVTNNTNYTVTLENCFIETIGNATAILKNKYLNGCSFTIAHNSDSVAKAVYIEVVITFK